MKKPKPIYTLLALAALVASSHSEARSRKVAREIQEQHIRGPYYCLMNCSTIPGGSASAGAIYLQNRNATTQILSGGRSEYEARYNTLNKCKTWCSARMQGALGAYLLDGPVLKCDYGKIVCDKGEE